MISFDLLALEIEDLPLLVFKKPWNDGLFGVSSLDSK